MSDALKMLVGARYRKEPVRISKQESAKIVAENPGQGLPLSILPAAIQRQLREGVSASLADCIAAAERLTKTMP